MNRRGNILKLAVSASLVAVALMWNPVAQARAGVAKPQELDLHLTESTYVPVKERDPFTKAGWSPVMVTTNTGTNTVPVQRVPVIPPNTFRLQGILFDSASPAAIVNNELFVLNKTVTLKTALGPLAVKAVEITRDRVVLAVNGQKIELRLNGDVAPKARKE